jgi:acyl-CoA thioester hydrolase
VVRFWNDDVLSNITGVLESLLTELQNRRAEPIPPGPGRPAGAGRRRAMAARSSAPASLAQPAAHLHRVRVYFEDTDAGGMVYYANYLKFAERARTEMLRSAGISHAEMVAADGLMLVVRRVTAEYKRSARLDDALEIETHVVGCGGASLTLDQIVRRGAEVLVELNVTIACVTQDGRPTRLPARIRQAVSAGAVAIN